MEVIEVATKITQKIDLLEKERLILKVRGENKANTLANYDKAIALAIIKIRNRVIKEYEGYPLDNMPANLQEKVAKGICYQEKLNMEIAEVSYKSLITSMDCLSVQTNALQSINRHLSEV